MGIENFGGSATIIDGKRDFNNSTRTDFSILKVSILLRQKIVRSNQHFNRRRSSLFPSVGSDSIFDDLNKFRRLLCRKSDPFRADVGYDLCRIVLIDIIVK